MDGRAIFTSSPLPRARRSTLNSEREQRRQNRDFKPSGLARIFLGNESRFFRELEATTVDPSDAFLVPDGEKR